MKNRKNDLLIWGLFVCASLIFVLVFRSMPLFPTSWTWNIGIGAAALASFFYLLMQWKRFPKILLKSVEVVLAVVLLVGSCLMPLYKKKVSAMIEKPEDKVSIYMDLYVMNDSYKAEHPEAFADQPMIEQKGDSLEDLKQYADAVFITEMSQDQKNQSHVIGTLQKEFGKNDLKTVDHRAYVDAAWALYRNEGQVLIMNRSYTDIFADIDGLSHFKEDTRCLYTIRIDEDSSLVEMSQTEVSHPFTVFIGGNDRNGDLSLYGRTDVNIMLTIDPGSHQMMTVFLPRDSFIPNPAFGNTPDKLTHLGVQGIQNTMLGLSSLFGIPVDDYVLINFSTFQQIIDALGGVDVNNPYAFGFGDDPNIWFEQGHIHLDGKHALLYVRERKTLPDGDFGRSMHQQLVMQGIITKLMSPAALTKIDSTLAAMKGTFLTNMTDEQIYDICKKQLEDRNDWKMVSYRLSGTTGSSHCASAGDALLSVVFPYADQVQYISEQLQLLVKGESISQNDLPPGNGMVVPAY